MLSFLALVNDLNDAHAKLVTRFEEDHEVDPELNPVALQDRLRGLQAKMIELKPKIEELQSVREELIETLVSAKSMSSIVEKIPEVAEQAATAERTLDAARLAAKGGGEFAKTGREGAKRTMRVEREARLASAMAATGRSPEKNSTIVDERMYDALSERVKRSVTLSQLQTATATLLRCGGKISQTSFPTEVAQALVELGVVTLNATHKELCLARRHGVLLL